MSDHRDPHHQERQFLWLALFVTVLLFLIGLGANRFSPDSWTFVELSNSIFSDFYRVNTIRQFEVTSTVGNSFPPLWPIVIASFQAIFHVGIYSGYIANLFLCTLLLIALRKLFINLRCPSWGGVVVYLALLSFPPFLDEALAARSMPLAMLLLVSSGVVATSARHSSFRAAATGALMGLAALTRFDFLPVGLVFGTLVMFVDWRSAGGRWVLTAALYFAVFLLTMAPWMVFCWNHFGKPFASDNSRQLLIAHGAFVTDYYRDGAPKDLISEPRKWLVGFFEHKLPLWLKGAAKAGIMSALLPLIIAISVMLGRRRDVLRLSGYDRAFLLMSLLLIPVMIFPAAAVGYADPRYFTGAILILYCCIAIVIFRTSEAGSLHGWAWYIAVASAIPAVLVTGIFTLQSARRGNSGLQPLTPTDEMKQVAAICNRDNAGRLGRLVDLNPTRAAQYGALTGMPTAMFPKVVEGRFGDFATAWNISHAYDPERALQKDQLEGTSLIETELRGLYRIQAR